MAKNAKNIVTSGLSGKLGDLIVFRQRGDETIVSTKPKKREGEASEGQKNWRARFLQAVTYGKAVRNIPDKKAAYAAAANKGKGQSFYSVAVADFLNVPEISEIDASQYNGEPGSSIRIRAIDDFRVDEVFVAIKKGDGSEVEHGMAAPSGDGLDWFYTAQAQNPQNGSSVIVVRVKDIPGNLAEATYTLQ